MECEQQQEIYEIATFKPLIALLFFFIIISLVNIPLLIYGIQKIARNPLYHLNTRVLLVAHAFGIIVHSADRLVLHSSDLYRWLIILPESSACAVRTTSERCFSLRLMLNCGMYFSICTTPTLVLERWIATKRIATYQKDRSTWFLMLLFQLLVSCTLLSFLYAETKFGGVSTYCITARATLPFWTLVAFGCNVAIQTLSILTFRYLKSKNEKLRKSLHETGSLLTQRYQVEESIRVLKTLYQPMHIMWAFLFTQALSSFFNMFFNKYTYRPLFYFLQEGVVLLPEYSIIFVITFLIQERSVKKLNNNSLKRNIRVQSEEYFDQYKKSWN